MNDVVPVSELRAAVLAAIDAHPDQVNPLKDDEACIYTSPFNPDHHCIVGQVAADFGWEDPGPSSDYVHTEAPKHGWPLDQSGIEFLTKVQALADEASWNSRPWSSFREDVEEVALD